MAASQEEVRHGEIPKISAKDVKYDETPIGRGGYGYVYRGTHAQLGTVAIKTMITDGILPARHQRVFKSESKALWELNHPSVVRLLGLIMEENNYSLVLEYMHFGSLSAFRTDFPNVSWSIIISIIRDVVTGMEFLHSKTPPILHLDMKSDNILINRKIRAKITDFGLAQWKTMTRTITQSQRKTEEVGRKGTVTHVPPEVWNNVNTPSNKAYDIYGFGIVVWEAVTGARPFGNTSDDIIPKAVLSGQRPDVGLVSRECPEKLLNMITQSWNQKPDTRPSFSELKSQIDVLFESFAHVVPKDLQVLETAIGELYSAEDIGGDTTATVNSETLYDVVAKINPPPRTPTPSDCEMANVEEQQTSQPSTSTTANQNTSAASTSNQNAPQSSGSANQTTSNTTAANENVFSEDEKKTIRRVLNDPVAMLLMFSDPSLCYSIYQISTDMQRELKKSGMLMKLFEQDPELKLDLMRRGTDYLGWLFNPQEMKQIIRIDRPKYYPNAERAEKMRKLRKEREEREEIEIGHRAPPQMMDTQMSRLSHFLKHGAFKRQSYNPYDDDDDDEPTMFGDLGYKVLRAFHDTDVMKYVMSEGRSAMIAPVSQEVLDVLRNPDRLVMMMERDPNFRAKLMKIDSETVMKIIGRARMSHPSSYGSSRSMRRMLYPMGLERDLMDMDLDEDDMMMRMSRIGDMDDYNYLSRKHRPESPSVLMSRMNKMKKPSMKMADLISERMGIKNKMPEMRIPSDLMSMLSKNLAPTVRKSAETSSAMAIKSAEKSSATAPKSAETSATAPKSAEKSSTTKPVKTSTSTKSDRSTSSSSNSGSSPANSTDVKKTDTESKKDESKSEENKDTGKEVVLKAPIQRQTNTQPLSTVYPPGLKPNNAGASVEGDDEDGSTGYHTPPEDVEDFQSQASGISSSVRIESDRSTSRSKVQIKLGSEGTVITTQGQLGPSVIQTGNNITMVVTSAKRGKNPETSSNSKKVKKNAKQTSSGDKDKNKESDSRDS